MVACFVIYSQLCNKLAKMATNSLFDINMKE